MIQAFGSSAQRFAAGLGDLEAIIGEPSTLFEAYLHAVDRRVRGDFFYGMILTPHPQAQLALVAALGVAGHTASDDERMVAMSAIEDGSLLMAGKSLKEIWSATNSLEDAMRREFYGLCDAVLVRSYAEATRLAPALSPSRQCERVLVEPQGLPDVRFSRRQGSVVTLVVWGTRLLFEQLAFYAIGLQEFIGEVVLVGAGGSPPPVRGSFLRADDPQVTDALMRASVVLCADADDPGEAVWFAGRGYGIVSPRTSGAPEFIRNVVTFDPLSSHQLFTAVAVALAQPALPLPLPAPLPRRPLPPPAPLREDELPLVTVILPTYNRREDLAKAIACIDAQRYPNIELIVVNDAGEDVSDVVARYPFARLITHAENRGALAAEITGLAQARGEFIQLLADDDILYPDHLERLVYAMLRTGAPAAHGNALIRYREQRPDGSWRTNGFNGSVFNDSTTPFRAMVSTPIAGQAICFRRRKFDEIGGLRADCDLADQEFQLRLWNACPVVWVDHVTAEWRLRGTSNWAARIDSVTEMRRLFEVLHPTDRPVLSEQRDRALNRIANRPPGFTFAATFTFPEQAGALTGTAAPEP